MSVAYIILYVLSAIVLVIACFLHNSDGEYPYPHYHNMKRDDKEDDDGVISMDEPPPPYWYDD